MKAVLRLWLLGVGLFLLHGAGFCYAQKGLPSRSELLQDSVARLMLRAEYQQIDRILRAQIHHPAYSEHEKANLLLLGVQSYAASARFTEASSCLAYCQRHCAAALRADPALHAQLIEAYADLAVEFQDNALRQSVAEKLETVYRHWDLGPAHRSRLARKLGVLHRMTKNYGGAETWFALAWQDLPSHCVDTLRLLNEQAIQAQRAGQPAAAHVWARQADSVARRCTNCRVEDRILSKIGLAEAHRTASLAGGERFEDLQSAEQLLRAAIAIGDSFPQAVYQPLLNGFRTLSDLVGSLGDIDEAIQLGRRGLEGQLRRNIAPKTISMAYMNLGIQCHYIGRLGEALQYFRLAMLYYPDYNSKTTTSITLINHITNYGQELIQNEEFAEGERYLNEAIARLIAFDPQDTSRLGLLHLNLAVGYEMQDSSALAAYHFQRAAALHPELLESLQHTGAQARIGAAVHLLKLDSLSAAAHQLQLGLQAISKLPKNLPMSRVFPLLDLANYYQLAGDLPAALRTNHALLQVVLFDFKSPDLYGCPNLENYLSPWYTLEAVSQKMDILWKMYRQSEDIQYLKAIAGCGENALALLRKLRQERNNDGEKLKVNEKWRKLFERSLRAQMELYHRSQDRQHLEAAFAIAEQSKGMMLLEAIVENQVLENAGTSSDLASQRRTLKGRMSILRRAIADDPSNGELVKQNQLALIALQKELDVLLGAVQAANPKYFNLVYEFEVVKIPALQEKLKAENRALLEYFYGDSMIYAFLVTGDELLVAEYPTNAVFEQHLQSFSQQLQAKPDAGDPNSGTAFVADSKIISAAIWQPLAHAMPEKVTIVPDGQLSYLSFEALVAESPAKPKPQFADLKFVLETHTLSYDYSATFYHAPIGATRNYEKGILAVAPGFANHPALQPLPEAIACVRELAEHYSDVDILVDEQATKASFLARAQNHAILDLATHGKYDKDNFLDSRVYFSPDGKGDSLLSLRELYSMNLPAELAILEACETGLGVYKQGEGVMNLARGFTYAGCESVLMSLWQVAEGHSTDQIIKGFYANLADGKPRDEAITQSKRDFLHALRAEGGERTAKLHPFYWSELVLIGKQGPIPLQKQAPSLQKRLLPFGLPALLCVLIAWVWRRKRQRLAQGMQMPNAAQ